MEKEEPSIILTSWLTSLLAQRLRPGFNVIIKFNFYFIFCLFIYSSSLWAQNESLKKPLIAAVEKKPYDFNKDLSFNFTYLPQDNFNLYYIAGISYTYQFYHYLAWEVININNAKNSPTGLEEYLKSNYAAMPELFDILRYYGTTSVVYTPLYMKNLYRGRSIVWGDISFTFGYGVSMFETAKSVNTVLVGTMMKFYASEHVSVKFDLREFFFMAANIKPNLGIGLSLAYNWGGSISEFLAAPVDPATLEEE